MSSHSSVSRLQVIVCFSLLCLCCQLQFSLFRPSQLASITLHRPSLSYRTNCTASHPTRQQLSATTLDNHNLQAGLQPLHLTTTLPNSTLLSPFTGRHSTAREGGKAGWGFVTMMPANTQTRHIGMWGGRVSTAVSTAELPNTDTTEHAHRTSISHTSCTSARHSAVSLGISNHLVAHSCPQDSVRP
jgi:hypothetical protein